MIFESQSGDVQSEWVRDINPEENNIYFTTSLSGWNTLQLGLDWLKQVFDRQGESRTEVEITHT